MTNSYLTAQSLGLTGTDAAIVETLQSLTASAIPVGNVTRWFADQGLGAFDPLDGRWQGKLVDLAKNDVTPQPVRDGLRKLFVFLGDRTTQTIDTTDPKVGMQFAVVLKILLQSGTITPEQSAAFYALDGGRPWKDLTVEQFGADRATAIADQAAAQERDKLDQQWADIANAADGINTLLAAGDRAGLVAYLRSAADTLEAG